MILFALGFFTLHSASLASILYFIQPKWTMVHWAMVDLAELFLLGIGFEVVYEYCTGPRAPSPSQLVEDLTKKIRRVLVGPR